MKNYSNLILLLLFFFIISCKPRQDFNYMKNIEDVAIQTSIEKSKNTLQVGDRLVILIAAKDMDVVKPFNQNYSTSELVQPNIAGGNTPNVGQQVISGPTYTIDENSNIDFPVLGEINTKGKSLVELKEEIEDKVSKYVINPSVNIRITNFKVTVLGEVNRQGDYTIPNGSATILNALGLAGDLTIYGERDNVLIVRNVDGEISKTRINLADANFVNSPFFYLKQGDVIYVSANETKQKTSRLNPNAGIYISVASVVLGLLALIFRK